MERKMKKKETLTRRDKIIIENLSTDIIVVGMGVLAAVGMFFGAALKSETYFYISLLILVGILLVGEMSDRRIKKLEGKK
jgi:hypothetical protein